MPNVCPKCNLGLKPVEENDIVFLKCSICGYKRELQGVAEHVCVKCGYGKATMTYIGVIRGDEEPVTLLKCLKCGNVERFGYAY